MAFAVQIAKGIFDLIRDDLALVEQEIAAQNSAAIEPVCEISSYLREGGGKRLRPALLLLAAGASGYRGKSATERKCTLGKSHERAGGRLAVHAVVRDGLARA
jgi:geranylgeranyl pyrophosphate synthase